MRNTKPQTQNNIRKLLVVCLVMMAVTLACINGVKPDDPRLQPPLSTVGKVFQEFLAQLNLVPKGYMMAPWITAPAERSFNIVIPYAVSGWAQVAEDATLVLYEVEPDSNLLRAKSIIAELGRIGVNGDNSWSLQVAAPTQGQYLAARLEQANGRNSPFSNIVYVHPGSPRELVILSPTSDSVVQEGKVTLSGSGEPRTGLYVQVNGERTPLTAIVGPDGNWSIADVPLGLKAFDKDKPATDLNRNELVVGADATGQVTESLIVRRIDPIQLVWPFGSTVDGKYVPDYSKAKLSAFYDNDWHRLDYSETHPHTHYAMDISSGDQDAADEVKKGSKIYAVSSGTVVDVGATGDGNYVIIDSGGWGTLYLHLYEDEAGLKTIGTTEGKKVAAGDWIATEGGSGGYPVHLHLEVRVWNAEASRNWSGFWASKNYVNINPSSASSSTFSKNNINLYEEWGYSDYCPESGCWANVDWSQVKLSPGSTPSSQYETACWKYNPAELTKPPVWSWTEGYYGLSRRVLHCIVDGKANAECACP